ncbi:glycosyltransferase [Shewanella glacialimarina]|jgi:glycosyltransferase involved in cell wall biosynthesis|uniref:glycosyltransferase n=1 Tax=Shewanella glacialimarina TaxID=2590884 RepID=UPI001CF91FC1|nr:glycosyltransferase [Shewanella glacialimarina]UCX03998.1 glycosyltransferase [Shewanella glacialimarina]
MIFITNSPVWSLGKGKGAPSFYKTLKLYNDKEHDVLLLTTEADLELGELSYLTVKKIPSLPLIKSHFLFGSFRLVNKLVNYFIYQLIGFCYLLLNLKSHKLIYAYEIGFVPAAKFCGFIRRLAVVSRFQGTILTSLVEEVSLFKKLYLKIKFLDHIWALKTKTNLSIMTNDGTKGLDVLLLLGRDKDDILFLSNGVDLPDFDNIELSSYTKNQKINDIVFSSVSRVQKWKRLDRSIDIFEKFYKANPNSHYNICGDGIELENMKAYVKNKKLCHAITFLGSIDKNTVYSVLQDSHYFLSSYSLSNLGNPLFEAIRCNNIVVTLDNGDTAKVIEDCVTGYISPELDYLKNADSLIGSFDNKVLFNEIVCNANKKLDEILVTWDERMNLEYSFVTKYLTFK